MHEGISNRTEATHSGEPRVGQVVRGWWSQDDLNLLRTFAKRSPLSHELLAAFPTRTVRAIRCRLTLMRQEENIVLFGSGPQVLDRDDPGIDGRAERRGWRAAAAVSNAAYLNALARAGYPVSARG